jgi:hypothetical protein
VSAAPIDTAFPPTQRIGIFVFEGFEPIDVFGFAEAFARGRVWRTSAACCSQGHLRILVS